MLGGTYNILANICQAIYAFAMILKLGSTFIFYKYQKI